MKNTDHKFNLLNCGLEVGRNSRKLNYLNTPLNSQQPSLFNHTKKIALRFGNYKKKKKNKHLDLFENTFHTQYVEVIYISIDIYICMYSYFANMQHDRSYNKKKNV